MFNLGIHELKNGNLMKRAAKHFITAATQGQDNSIEVEALMDAFTFKSKSKRGFVIVIAAKRK